MGDDRRLARVLLGVEHLVGDASLGEKLGQALGALYGGGAHEHGLARGVARRDLLHDGRELDLGGAEDHVVLVDAGDGSVGGNRHDVEAIGAVELGGLGRRGAGHARELAVHAEVVLQRDGGHGAVFGADRHALLGLDGLVESLRPAAALHDAPRGVVDDLDLVSHDDVVLVAVEEVLGPQRL